MVDNNDRLPNGTMDNENSATTNKQNSLVTIFSIWNTMVGTSLLAMPWGMERSGLPTGLAIAIVMGAVCLYTAYCNIETQKQHGSVDGEVFQLSNQLLGPWAERIAKIFSFIVLLGAVIIYWILMSNFFNFSVDYVHSVIYGQLQSSNSKASVLCPSQANKIILNVTSSIIEGLTSTMTPQEIHYDNSAHILKLGYTNINTTVNFLQNVDSDTFHRYWNLKTVPIYLAVIIGPLLCFRSPTFFTKFNSLGTMSVMYLMLFVIIKSAGFGFNNISFTDKTDKHYTEIFNSSFGAMSGMLALSYFIHNIIISLVRNNKHQENNVRDLSIAYILVTLTYTFIGTVFYLSFPLNKSCIEDNMLNNFEVTDTLTVIARVFLFFQLVTVYPLIAFMLRSQVLLELTGKMNPSSKSVLFFNITILVICILFAIFIPRIGTVIRFTGAISGFIHVFTLPCLLRIASLKKRGELTLWSMILNLVIPILGGINILLQFFIKDK